MKNQNTNIRDWAFTELFTPTPTPKDGKSIRNLDYHLIKFDNGTQQFFNMTIDPTEQTNLLLQNLSAAELSNYNYLCNELSTLTGISSCLSGVSVNDIAHDIETLQIHEEANGLIRFDADTPYTVIVYTAIGTPLFTIQFTAGMHTLPLSAYAKGMYIVEMKTNEQRKIQK
ncbi:MAG: hypothetical protein IPH46_09150 [Bacteroidetes bacterium]|nr:hypothetical protein [Bacteroidota bacterium]